MSTKDAFLAAICASPDDDSHRLVYADWLEEHDHPAEAEFVRLQCELAKAAERSQRRKDLVHRQTLLLAQNRDRWEQPLRALGASGVEFERGFPETVTVGAEDLLKHHDRLFSIAPVRRVQVFPCQRELGLRVAQSPFPPRLRHLDLNFGHIGDDAVETLASSPALAGLTSLGLKECDVSDRGVRALARSPYLHHLSRLDLADNSITDDGALVLATAPHLNALRELDLSWNRISDVGARALADGNGLSGLRKLELRSNPVGTDTARAVHLKLGRRERPGSHGLAT